MYMSRTIDVGCEQDGLFPSQNLAGEPLGKWSPISSIRMIFFEMGKIFSDHCGDHCRYLSGAFSCEPISQADSAHHQTNMLLFKRDGFAGVDTHSTYNGLV